MKKKIFSLILIFLLLFNYMGGYIFAETNDQEYFYESSQIRTILLNETRVRKFENSGNSTRLIYLTNDNTEEITLEKILNLVGFDIEDTYKVKVYDEDGECIEQYEETRRVSIEKYPEDYERYRYEVLFNKSDSHNIYYIEIISWDLYNHEERSTRIHVVVEVTELSIKNAPTKKVYVKGEDLDLTGGIILEKDCTNQEHEYNMNRYNIKGYDKNTLGVQTVTVFENGLDIGTFNVTVKNDITGISMKTNPKTTYIKGENLNLTGGTISVMYEDGTVTEVPLTDSNVTVTGYQKDQLGNQELTVNYKGKETKLNVRVKNDLVSIAMKKNPKTTYIKGEELDLTNGTISATYEDGTIAEIPLTSEEITVTGYEKNNVKNQELTVNYKGKETKLNVRVKNDLVSIAMKTNPKTTYIKGEELDLRQGVINATYEDGSITELALTLDSIQATGFDKNVLGEQTITINYGGKHTSFKVNVKNDLVSIAMKTNPSKTTYIKGENLDVSDGTIIATYEDNSTKEIPLTASEVAVLGYDENNLGTQTITVRYNDKITSFNVNVKNDLVKITMKENPKTTYVKGEELDLTNGKIIATYEDESTNEIPLTAEEVAVTGYDANKLGEQTITVKYNDKQTSYKINVKNEVKEIIIKTMPKTVYIQGEELDIKNGTISVKYEDNTAIELPLNSYGVFVTGYDSDTLGSQKITVTYGKKSTTYNVQVKNELLEVSVKSEPSKKTYIKGEKLDLTGGKILAKYEDGTTAEILMTAKDVVVTGYDSNKLGEQTINLSYNGKNIKLKVSIKNDIVNIQIKELPDKITYVKGEELDLSGGTLLITYEDGSTAEVPMTSKEIVVTGFDSSNVKDQEIKLEYNGQTIGFELQIKKSVVSVELRQSPAKIIYTLGEELDLTGGTILTTYDDGSVSEIPITAKEIVIKNYDANKLGEQTVQIEYNGQITTMKINTIKEDNTTIKGIIPQTGQLIIILPVMTFIFIALLSLIIYKKKYQEII